MDISQLQRWLVDHGQQIAVDGIPGPKTREAIKAAFVNLEAPAVTTEEIAEFAATIGCTEKQVRAVATVESGGSGFTNDGRPKILFERHYFWRLTEGRFGRQIYSDPSAGGYDYPSWDKLAAAACKDPMAAFASASWGKFQVMGAHAIKLGYISPLAMAYAMRQSEADHYDVLVRYITTFGLADEVRRLSTNPDDCRAFASGYNGKGYEKFSYHEKLARAMR